MHYPLTAAFITYLLFPEPTCLTYDRNQAAQVLNRVFYQDQFWQMPSKAGSGNVIFVTKREARQRAVLVSIPVMRRSDKPATAVSLGCADLQADYSAFAAFVLNKTTPVSLMKVLSTAPTGYISSISNDQEDLDVKALYQAYLQHRDTFFYCSYPVGRFAYFERGQLYVWDTDLSQFRIPAN